MVDHPTDTATEVFVAHRNLLFLAAHELLGSAADAEDVLQETWFGDPPTAPSSAGAWLNRCFDERLGSGTPQPGLV